MVLVIRRQLLPPLLLPISFHQQGEVLLNSLKQLDCLVLALVSEPLEVSISSMGLKAGKVLERLGLAHFQEGREGSGVGVWKEG